jgi:NADH-quinone oxidoreductase subunit L
MGEEKSTAGLSLTEAPVVMRMPVALLAVASTWLVVSLNPFDIYGGHLHSIEPQGYFESSVVHPTRFYTAAAVSTVVLLITLFCAYHIYKRKTSIRPSGLLNKVFYLDAIYEWIFVKPSLAIAATSSAIDSKWIDGIIHAAAYVNVTASHLISWVDKAIVDGTVHAFAATARGVGSFARSFQGGKIQLYIFWAALGLIIFIIWILVQ